MNDYWMPWRVNYEAWATALLLLAGIGGLLAALAGSSLPASAWWLALLPFGLLTGRRGWAAWRLWHWQRNLIGRPPTGITLAALAALSRPRPSRRRRQPPAATLWLGWGFEWRPWHTQRAHECLTRLDNPVLRRDRGALGGAMGVGWLHGIADPGEEAPVQLPLDHGKGHLLLLGSTRTYKTVLLRLLAAQAVLRGEPVIVIDPKGDRALWQTLRAACRHAGRGPDFCYFHPAFPEQSVRIDPLYHWNTSTEPAARIAALLPADAEAQTFTGFAWDVLNNIVHGLLEIERRPSLVLLRRYAAGGVDELLGAALSRYAARVGAEDPALRAAVQGARKGGKVADWIRVYRQVLQPVRPSSALEGLIAMAEHDRIHMSKMIAGLTPVLGKLTSAPLDSLLSPDPAASDPRRLVTVSEVLAQRRVLYVGLDTLSNAEVGSAIGALLLADLAAAVGATYNFSEQAPPFTLIVDEAGAALNPPTIELLNKGAGGGARLILAAQTVADFTARLGDPARAMQVLGNVNNVVCGRVVDADTQAFFSESLPATRVRTTTATQGENSDASQPVLFSGSRSEAISVEESPLIAPTWLGLLPNLECYLRLSGSRLVKARLPILQLDPADQAPLEKPRWLTQL